MAKKQKILLVEDSPALARVYQEYLRDEVYEVTHVSTVAESMQALNRDTPDLCVLDLRLPDGNGMQVLRYVQEQQIPTPVVIITAHGSVETAVEAIQAGAADFLEKPFTADRLIVTLKNALEHGRLKAIVDSLESLRTDTYAGFIGSSISMQAVYQIIDNAAPSKASVFITGESGTGKEVCAEAIHLRSPRAEQPFVALNCAAIPRELIESEIFGHVKGAFTGAQTAREGAASRADGGTLFLDEIAEMDIDLQAKLLRYIQTGSFQKVGSAELEKVDVRFICATNRDPLAEVEAGRFREDLYYRLHVIPIELPPLHERDDDVLAIGRSFLEQYSIEEGKAFIGFHPDVEQILLQYDWPGNVRQLQNVIRNIVVLHDGELVSRDMLPSPLNRVVMHTPAAVQAGSEATSLSPEITGPEGIRPLWQIERDVIEQAIAACGDNIPKAAALLDISASTIYRKRVTWKERDQQQENQK